MIQVCTHVFNDGSVINLDNVDCDPCGGCLCRFGFTDSGEGTCVSVSTT